MEGQREVCFSDKNLKVGVSKYGHVIYGSVNAVLLKQLEDC